MSLLGWCASPFGLMGHDDDDRCFLLITTKATPGSLSSQTFVISCFYLLQRLRIKDVGSENPQESGCWFKTTLWYLKDF